VRPIFRAEISFGILRNFTLLFIVLLREG